MAKRNVIEMERFARDSLKNEEGFLKVTSSKELVEIFVKSSLLYQEIKEPFEKYGYKVFCGKKPRMS